MKKSRGKSKSKLKPKNFEAATQEEHDKIFGITEEMRKELNKKEGWKTGSSTGKAMTKRKIVKTPGTVTKKGKVDFPELEPEALYISSNVGVG